MKEANPESAELGELDGVAQAELVRHGGVSARELVEAAARRIERRNPAVNAVIAPLLDEALAAASSADLSRTPFMGLPLLLKDIGATQAGLPQYSGSRALLARGHRSAADTELGARFRRAGFVVAGLTNTSEFGSQPTTQPLAFGPTRNPWDPARSVAGSSGGAAAAVAAGMVPIAHGSDIAGSIRMPSSWCGTVGLKPSRGRVPVGPLIARDLVEHVITRTVRDTAAVLDAVHGAEPGALHIAPPPARAYADEVGADPGALRIGLLSSVDAAGVAVHPECVAAVQGAGRALEALGHAVEPGGPAALFDDAFVANWTGITAARLNRLLETLGASLGHPVTANDVEPYQLAFAARGEITARALLALEEWQQPYAARVASWWARGHDLLVTPATGEPPALLDELLAPPDDPLAILPRFLQIQCFAIPFSVTGQPAISLPLHQTGAGLPVGVQLVAPHGAEDTLIRVAAQLEAAHPWGGARPPAPGG
jgi:amidase